MNSNLKIRGHLQIRLNGEIVVDDHNLIVDVGKAWAASMLGGSQDYIVTLKTGSVGTAPDPLDMDLADPNPVSVALSNPGGDVYNNVIEYVGTLEEQVGTGEIKEAGLFSRNGVMLARKAFPVINKMQDDVMTIAWTITVV
jgi:hypothetical protein